MGAENKIEKWIDEALREYGRADAGPGFEGRLFARVRQREEAVRARRFLQTFGLAAALAAALLAGIWLAYRPHLSSHLTAEAGSGDMLPRSNSGRKASTRDGFQVAKASKPLLRNGREIASPKLNHFPSPAPLSKQEQILARYVMEYGQQAVMLAQAQTYLAKQELLEEQSPKKENAELGADNAH